MIPFMSTDSIDVLLEELDNGDRAAQQNAVRGIFNEILKRVKEDIVLLTEFNPIEINIIQKVGKSLAIIGKAYLEVIGHMILIQEWGDEWKTFITLAFTIYQKQYLSLYHTTQGIYMFLVEKNNIPKHQDSRETWNGPSDKPDTEKFDEIMSMSKKNYQPFTENYFEFYIELLTCVADLSPKSKS